MSSGSLSFRWPRAARGGPRAVACGLALQVVFLAMSGLLSRAQEEPAGRDAVPAQKALGDSAVPGPSPELRDLALAASDRAHEVGYGPKPLLTIIDYSLPSSERRLWVLDLGTREILFYEYVAHGRGSGTHRAMRFANEPESRASSLGLFETGEVYRGKHGLSLRLDGLEPGFNDRARERAIVMHGAWYVSEEQVEEYGSLGRSWGCPALDLAITRRLIERIAGGSLLLAYYPDPDWLSSSRFLAGANDPPDATATGEGQ